MILRAIGLVKEVYDWISFSEQAFSWLGLAQRAAAVAAGAAVVAAPIVVATKPWQPAPAAPATVTAPAVPGTPGAPVPLTAAEVDKHIDKITKDNLYSRIFLMQPERRELLKTIVAKCKDTTEIVAAHSKIGASFASTSSMIDAGNVSTLRALRAPRSSTRGWSQRTTPIVLMPVTATANPTRRTKSPPLVIGQTTGNLVASLNSAGDTIKTGRLLRCSRPSVGSSETR
jgi:hypothetical protein